jgi:hypothetical protein
MMRSAIGVVAAAVGLGVCGPVAAAEGEWVDLLAGDGLEGWVTEGNWVREEGGILAIRPREGEKGWQRYDAYLWHEGEYGDFELKLEFRHEKGGNSGVFFRVGDVANPVDTGMEVQILDSYGKEGEMTHHDNGGVIRTAGPTENASRPAGEWNEMTVRAEGDSLQVELNGKKVIDIKLSETDSKDKPKSGAIGLQDHGDVVWFRNVKVRGLGE